LLINWIKINYKRNFQYTLYFSYYF